MPQPLTREEFLKGEVRVGDELAQRADFLCKLLKLPPLTVEQFAVVHRLFIRLSNGGVATIDIEDYELVSKSSWYREDRKNTSYAKRNLPLSDRGNGETRYMHVLIAGRFVDHANGNGLDNRRKNLRPANKQQNGANAALSIRNTSGIKGVSIHGPTGKWRAVCRFKHLGLFKSKKKAADAYRAESKRVFGEFARP